MLTTTTLLRRRAQNTQENGKDDRTYTESINLEGGLEEPTDSDDGDGDTGNSIQPVSEQPDEWEEEEATEEELLLYFQAQGAVQDYELKDYRDRKRKVVVDQERWNDQMPELLEAYLDYCLRRRRSGQLYEGEVRERHILLVWSVFEHSNYEVPVFTSDRFNNTSYLRSGFLPFNPLVNKSVVSLEAVELYHHLFMHCPRLGIQPFIRALCDLQGVHFKNNVSVQFASAYDLYIRLVDGVRNQVLSALGRLTPNYWMLNTCPACQYEVEGEPAQPIRMMAACDGNNSLKWFQRREPSGDGRILGTVKERPDTWVGGGDYFLLPETVDLWDEPNWGKWLDWAPTGRGAKNSCADHWSNMNESKTARSFGCFEVNGLFARFCCHSFVLVFADMLRTGEQSKYFLALLHHFMSACRDDQRQRGLPNEPIGSLGVGYDIACGMVDKITRSPLTQLAQDEKLHLLIVTN
ncbi:hypothetical protein GGU11DRAFT_751119 [Lentinula aff. detonsa]|nr:hypothetical protein GGU11DRAFT_751119 [Lentinula aff. detonsa]